MTTLTFPAPFAEGIGRRDWLTEHEGQEVRIIDQRRRDIDGEAVNYKVMIGGPETLTEFATIDEAKAHVIAALGVDDVVLPGAG